MNATDTFAIDGTPAEHIAPPPMLARSAVRIGGQLPPEVYVSDLPLEAQRSGSDVLPTPGVMNDRDRGVVLYNSITDVASATYVVPDPVPRMDTGRRATWPLFMSLRLTPWDWAYSAVIKRIPVLWDRPANRFGMTSDSNPQPLIRRPNPQPWDDNYVVNP